MAATAFGPPNLETMVRAGSMARHCSDPRYIRKPPVANSETAAVAEKRYTGFMTDLAQWLEGALQKTGISQAALARALTKIVGRNIDRAAVNKMLPGGSPQRRIAADEMLAIEEITGVPSPMRVLQVPLVSWVSAGRMEPSMSVTEADIEGNVPAVGLPRGEWIALRVKGDSMDRVAPEGAIIFVNRADQSPVTGGKYVFTLGDDEATFKEFRSNPDRLKPLSTNPEHEDIFPGSDLRVFGRVARIEFDLPQTERP